MATRDIQLIGAERILLPKKKKFNLFETLWTPGGKPAQRGALITVFNLDGRAVRFVNLHLDWQGGFGQRARQLTYIASLLTNMPHVDGEVICGDFNTIGGRNAARRQEAQIQQILGDGYINIFPAEPYTTDSSSIDYTHRFGWGQLALARLGVNIHQRLDYMFVKGFQNYQARVERVKGSDHYPLVATLKVPS